MELVSLQVQAHSEIESWLLRDIQTEIDMNRFLLEVHPESRECRSDFLE
jgi:hypothetical protein